MWVQPDGGNDLIERDQGRSDLHGSGGEQGAGQTTGPSRSSLCRVSGVRYKSNGVPELHDLDACQSTRPSRSRTTRLRTSIA